MSSEVHDFVMNHPMFSHHDHHCHFKEFEEKRLDYDAASLLGYAIADIETAAGPKSNGESSAKERIAAYWPRISTTGYGRAVTIACEALFDSDYSADNFGMVTDKLQSTLSDKSAAEVYDYFVKEKANVTWVLQDGYFAPGNEDLLQHEVYPDYYRFAWRMDELFSITDATPIELLERVTGITVHTLPQLVEAMNANIDRFRETGRLAAFKLGIAYARDLVVGEPTTHEAELAFDRIRNPKAFHEGIQQNGGAVNARELRALSDYMIHRLLQRASDEDIPVQVHTGYLAGNWGSLAGTKALHLIPVFERYREVRFDVFHASWPWTSELGAIAKNYPNVYPDMCWAWAMNPTESERTLAEWLDGVPFNKIFAFGADTGLPWCEVGYSIQARLGIARVLEKKVRKGFFSEATAREVASAIMLENGERFHGIA
jgi:predicted TIM-barrel fold metal-dependent hydrolase